MLEYAGFPPDPVHPQPQGRTFQALAAKVGKQRGVSSSLDFAILTNEIMQ